MIIGGKTFDFDRCTYVMGILNVTPDSFSDGGRWNTKESALRAAVKMAEEGVEGVKITAVNIDGSVVGHVPLTCVLFRRPPAKMELTPEERERRSANMRHLIEAQKTAQKDKGDNWPFEPEKDEN